MLIAGVLSFIGHPLVHLIDKIKIGKRKVPHSISASLTLLLMIVTITVLTAIFAPIISEQAKVIANIDFAKLESYMSKPLSDLESFLSQNKIITKEQTLNSMISEKLKEFVDMSTIQNAFGGIIGFAGSIFIGLFSVLFLTFFFLKDEKLFFNAILLFVPDEYDEKASRILSRIREGLSRYFIGLSIEIFTMMLLIFLGLKIMGVENALLIGFLGGLMNVIPYVGPIIGTLIGVFITTETGLSMEVYDIIPSMALTVMSVFLIANMIDNFILQPIIYSNVVQAHPVEIFLIILIAGSIAGILGMIFAIPSYMLFRIVLSELFDGYDITDKLTNNQFT